MTQMPVGPHGAQDRAFAKPTTDPRPQRRRLVEAPVTTTTSSTGPPPSNNSKSSNRRDGFGNDVVFLQGPQHDPTGEVAFFLGIPWCRAHLRPGEGRPPGAAAAASAIVVRTLLPYSRRQGRARPRADGTFPGDTAVVPDNAFSTTLNTQDTIAAMVLFYEEELLINGAPPSIFSPHPIVELKALVQFGSGLNGHVGVLHGGLVATILDEVLGLLIPLNQRRYSPTSSSSLSTSPASPPEDAAAACAHIRDGVVTGYLHTTYVKPVRTPAPVLVTVRFTRRDGPRKFYVEGAIWNGEAQLLAKAEALFVALKERL